MATTQQQPLYIGIDGGGSKCKVVLVDAAGTVLGEGMGGPANPLRGLDVAISSITTAVDAALHQALSQHKVQGTMAALHARLVVGAGLAGVNIPHYLTAMQQWQHPYAALYLTTDLHVACLGAHQGADGAVMIAGTGSCGLAAVAGQCLSIGGYGFPASDNGSGAWFGMQALRAVLHDLDGMGAETLMTSACLAQHQISTHAVAIAPQIEPRAGANTEAAIQLATIYMHATPTQFARLAPIVFDAAEQGDSVARTIIDAGAAELMAIAQRLMQLSPPRLSMIGGIAPRIYPYLSTTMQQWLQPSLATPELGAVFFAKAQHHATSGNHSPIQQAESHV
jgi:glucosamine kinase